ncbi:FadR/GntR family transcriptional regulator [Arthrobacter sp. NPDC092385]|uniref:FadR/GntR family transcriptional regulator n=1 Tax=Arthrobacter sp. NPDC092385 TaxID=3363943 RepID=UPI003808F41E
MQVSDQAQTRTPPLEGLLSAPLQAHSRGDEIADRLVTAIAVGEYLPGARLPSERDLAISLGVGRMTVREAIARLVSQGILETRRGRNGGSFVTGQPEESSGQAVQRTLGARWESMRDLRETLCLLHGALARSAADNRSDEDVVVLRARLEDFRAAASGKASQSADAALHAAISAATHNALLGALLAEVEARLNLAAPSHPWGPVDGVEAMEARALKDHELLVAAICSQDSDAAEGIARQHVKIDFEMIEAALSRTTASTSPRPGPT